MLEGKKDIFSIKEVDSALFLDLETNGILDVSKTSYSNCQPDIIQFAFLVVDIKTRKTLQKFSSMVSPSGWSVPEQSSVVDGITNKLVVKYGIPIELILPIFNTALKNVDLVVAHNFNHEKKLIEIANSRYFGTRNKNVLNCKNYFCTMKESVEILKIPPTRKMISAGMNFYKTPKLYECYNFFTGKHLSGAHDALCDAEACRDVFFGLLDFKND